MYKKILIPLDNSPTDEPILAHIRSLARLTKAKLVLVHVADGYVARFQEQLDLADSDEIKQDQEYLTKRTKELAGEGFDVKNYLLAGDPPAEILKVAHEEGCDLIAMSTHGHRFLKDVLLGSVAENIRHRTDIPILMIRALK
ncbi:MAG: universal stress protein UspA [Omnitrophica WOR_2 bacterium RIFCSPHIGHO2_01_FULL_48_9]|nr:MAG: universal stress protein UspA [Omnitrophica WOR_2 bacterium RIFCSPHIGHO2_02_FULL_48_11]OGX34164.1 MAG: universal stress protein UspA [Omnitrophica WOR_2 bacterium RIFCSPHIGHO2_01_FULL_48_9]